MNEAGFKGATGQAMATNSEPEVSPKPWFCVALSPSGTVFKGDAESSAGFMEILDRTTIAWVDYVAQDADFDKEALAAIQLGFSEQLISSFTGESYLNYQDFDSEMGMKVPSIQVRQLVVEPYPLLLLLRKNFILTIHPLSVDRRFTRLRRYAETFMKKIPTDALHQDKLTILLMRILDHNNDRNFEHLRQIEERGDELNETMTDPYTPRAKLGPEIYHMKHALITYLNALWDTVDVLHTLRYGDAELITDDPRLLDKLGMLAEDVNRQIGLAEHLSEVLASGLEVLQSIYNNQLQNLNNRLALLMTYLTIIGTAVLVPNTLATMLGNTVFDIGPRDLGWYLALMIGSTVVATGLVYWWVRRRGWIPRKMDRANSDTRVE
jgi:magnesium transporter